MTLGHRIASVRKHIGLTQKEFGERIGVAGNTVTNYESNNRTPVEAIIKGICREFNVDYLWLTTGEGEMFVDSGDIAQVIDRVLSCENDFAKRAFTGLAAFDEADWRDVERLVDKLLHASEPKKK